MCIQSRRGRDPSRSTGVAPVHQTRVPRWGPELQMVKQSFGPVRRVGREGVMLGYPGVDSVLPGYQSTLHPAASLLSHVARGTSSAARICSNVRARGEGKMQRRGGVGNTRRRMRALNLSSFSSSVQSWKLWKAHESIFLCE